MKKHNLALAISIILSMTACGGRDNNSNAPIDSTPSETNHTQGGQTTNDTQNSSDDEQKTDDKQSAGKKTTGATGSTGSATAGNGGNAAGNNNSSLPPVLQEEPKPTDDSKDLNEKQGVLLVTGDNKPKSFTINNLNAQLQENGLLSNNKAAESKEITLGNNKKITATTVTDDTSPIVNNYRFYNQNLTYAKFGATSTHFTNKDQSSASVPPVLKSFSTGAITESFDDNLTNKEATYSGNAIVVAAKDNNEPQTLFADFSATVQFGVAKDFTGNINNFKKQNANGELEQVSDFHAITLKGLSTTSGDITTDGAYPISSTEDTTFLAKFYGDNGRELSGTFSGKTNEYGKYYGSFGGKRGDATAVSTIPKADEKPFNERDPAGKIIYSFDETSENKVDYLNQEDLFSGLLIKQGEIDSDLTTTLPNNVVQYTQITDSFLINSYNDKSYSYSQFGIRNSIIKPEKIEEINTSPVPFPVNPYDVLTETIYGRYSIGQLTTNFNDVITKIAKYQGTALLSAQKPSEKLETYLADFNATVDFSKSDASYDAFQGTINNFRVKDRDSDQFSSVTFNDSITLNGALNPSSENQSIHISSSSSASTRFSGAFYGPNAAEVGGIFSGNNTELGKYEGSFGGKK